MKLISSLFSKLYQYATICIIVGSPLFFIPKTRFAPDVTYYVTMLILVAVALVSYVVSALLTRSWQTLSRLEFISYFVFAIAILLSVAFSKNQYFSLFGETFNEFSGVTLLSLPAVMYLVRALPENIRYTMKHVMVIILGVSAFLFTVVLMMSGTIGNAAKQVFSGFASPISFAVYIGLFAIACLFFIKKITIPKKHKVIIGITALLFCAWAFALSSQDGIRPNNASTYIVAKNTLMKEGVFGIGAGNFARAWQLYRPENVIASAYFSYDFARGSSTVGTFLVTIGLVGILAFLFMVIAALYNTFIAYRANPTGKDHFIVGLLLVALAYFTIIAFIVPLSYAMLLVWMAVAGLGLAKTQLSEYHPSKKASFVMVPLAALLLVSACITVQRVNAFMYYNKAQNSSDMNEIGVLLNKAIASYKYDGFYRVQVEYLIQTNRNLIATPAQDQEALKAEYLRNAQAAVDAGLAAVKNNPDNYQNYVSLGRAYELAVPFDKAGGYDNAKKSYSEAIKLYPDNPYLYIMLARLEASAGTREGVRSGLTEAIKKKNNFADALYLMSQLEASENRIDDALAYAIEAVKNAPNDPLVYIQAGLLFYGKRDYANAVQALTMALQRDQNNANIAYFLALALRDGGRPDLAKTIADELIRRNPGNADLEAFLKSLNPQPISPTKKATKK
jgi:tetratricopeptide (TPR) repeat protein